MAAFHTRHARPVIYMTTWQLWYMYIQEFRGVALGLNSPLINYTININHVFSFLYIQGLKYEVSNNLKYSRYIFEDKAKTFYDMYVLYGFCTVPVNMSWYQCWYCRLG